MNPENMTHQLSQEQFDKLVSLIEAASAKAAIEALASRPEIYPGNEGVLDTFFSRFEVAKNAARKALVGEQ